MDRALLSLSLCFYIVSLFTGKKRAGIAFFSCGWLLNICAILWVWRLNASPPFGNLYQVMVALGACFFPAYLVIAARQKMHWAAGYFSSTAALPLGFTFFLKQDYFWHSPPALQSIWFAPHVAAYTVSYAMAVIAILSGSVALIKRIGGDLAGYDRYEKAAFEFLTFGFPLMLFGMLSGALWADSIWARFWSWDIKEVWSLVTLLLYAAYFCVRRGPKGQDLAFIAQLIAFLALLTTFLLVNLLPKLSSKLHSYTYT